MFLGVKPFIGTAGVISLTRTRQLTSQAEQREELHLFNRNNRRGLGKLVLTGSLVAALAVPMAGSAFAAPVANTVASKSYVTVLSTDPSTFNWAQYANLYSFDVNELLQQFQENIANGGAGSTVVPTTPSGTGSTAGTSHTGTGTVAGSKAGTGTTAGSSHTGTSAGSKPSTSTSTGSKPSVGTNTGSKASSGTAAGSGLAGTNTGSKPSTGTTAGSTHAGTSTGSKASSGSASSGSAAGSSSNAGSTATQSNFAAQVVSLVNQERAKAGLKPLKSDTKLTSVATAKAKDMYTNNYFDHTSPTYGSPFDMMKQFGVSYSYAGENIAKGQQNPQAVMDAWMNSSGHRANILNANYTSIGVAYYNGEWVQEFTG